MDYRIVKIIDEYLVVVNYGYVHNAEVGDLLQIYEIGEQVTDPKTNEDLGTLDVMKGKIKVVNVYEKMSLCQSNEFTASTSNDLMSKFNYLANALTKSEIQALNVNTKEITGGYKEGRKKTINLNDPVLIIRSGYEEEQQKKSELLLEDSND